MKHRTKKISYVDFFKIFLIVEILSVDFLNISNRFLVDFIKNIFYFGFDFFNIFESSIQVIIYLDFFFIFSALDLEVPLNGG